MKEVNVNVELRPETPSELKAFLDVLEGGGVVASVKVDKEIAGRVDFEDIKESGVLKVAETPVIPTTVLVTAYTQEQIARAMGAAIDAGKMELIQETLKKFGARSLQDIKLENYGEIAQTLEGVGIKVV